MFPADFISAIVAGCDNRIGFQTEATVDNELADRQQAIKLHLAGRSVEEICGILNRSRDWFNTWWRRYRIFGPNGLFDLTRSNVQASADLTRTRTDHRRNSAKTDLSGTSRHTLQPHWGQFNSSRTSDLAHPSFAGCPDGGAGPRAQRRNGPEGAPGALPGWQHLSQTAGRPLQISCTRSMRSVRST